MTTTDPAERLAVQQEVDHYIAHHPYLAQAVDANERLALWMAHQPDWRVIARFVAEAEEQNLAAARQRGRDEAVRPTPDAIADALNSRFERLGGPLESWTPAMWRREIKAAILDAQADR